MDIVTLALAKQYANKKITELTSVGFAPMIVNKLPSAAEANSHTLYLIPASDSIEENGYLEYLWINNAWECVGSTKVDFSMIGNVDELTTVDKTSLVAAINEIVNDYVTKQTLNTTVSNLTRNIAEIYATKEDTNNQITTINTNINNITTNYATTEYVNNLLNSRVFQGNTLVWETFTEKEQGDFDIAVVEEIAVLSDEDLALVNSIVGGEPTDIYVDLSENEIHDTLDDIIGEDK